MERTVRNLALEGGQSTQKYKRLRKSHSSQRTGSELEDNSRLDERTVRIETIAPRKLSNMQRGSLFAQICNSFNEKRDKNNLPTNKRHYVSDQHEQTQFQVVLNGKCAYPCELDNAVIDWRMLKKLQTETHVVFKKFSSPIKGKQAMEGSETSHAGTAILDLTLNSKIGATVILLPRTVDYPLHRRTHVSYVCRFSLLAGRAWG
jgi:hypothetical protein